MRLSAAILGLALLLLAPTAARAQAYIEEPNSLSVALAYTYAPSGKVVADGDLEVPGVDTLSHTFIPSAQYVTPVPGLQVEAEVTLMAIKVGDDVFQHFPRNGPYDDGELHFTPVDARAGLRYQVKAIEEYFGLSFMVAGSIPTTDYPTYGLSAPGHHLKAAYAGLALARTLDPLLPNLYFQTQYEFALRERVDTDEDTKEIGRNLSDVAFQIGYFLPWDLSIGAGANLRFSHGGIDLKNIIFEPEGVQNEHDRLLNEDFVLVGGNIGYSATESLELGFQARFFVTGTNTRNQNLYALYAAYRLF